MFGLDQDQWIIVGLIFLLGILVGALLFSGGGRKWKERYKHEVERRERIEADYERDRTEWRERDSLRGAALRDRDRKVDADRDGVDDRVEAVRDDRPTKPGD